MKETAKIWLQPELRGVELLRARYVTQRFGRHVHDGFGVGVIEHGALGFYYRGANIVAHRGMINTVNPDEVHTGHAVVADGWAYRMFYFDTAVLQRAASEMSCRNEPVPYFNHGAINDTALACALQRLHISLDDQTTSSQLERESLFLALLTQLIVRHGDTTPKTLPIGNETTAVDRTRDYMEAHFADRISVHDLARLAHVSPFHFIRVFQKQLGMPPHTYLLQTRLRHARNMLAKGCRIVDAALDTGFVDQSHFTRHFKRTFGITPAQYRNFVQDV